MFSEFLLPFEDWPTEGLLLALVIIAILALALIYGVYRLAASQVVQDWLDGVQRAFAKLIGRGADIGQTGSGASAADEEISTPNMDWIKRRFERVESRLKACESSISSLFRSGVGSVKGSGGSNINYNDVRGMIYDLIRENPNEIKRLLGIATSGVSLRENSDSRREVHPPVQPQGQAGREERRVPAQDQSHRGRVTPTRAYLDLCKLYNAGLNDQIARSDFKSKYSPVTISVVNAKERRRDGTVPAEFQTANDGNFLAVRLDSGGQYAVFPKFNLVLGEASYGPGAIGEVFDCPGFDPRFSYTNISVEAPAIFVARGGDAWVKDTDGVLNVGEPQRD